jgi:IclR family acetate operon transcriptional repressor
MEENEVGGACVAAPIFGPAGEAVAAVSIAGPAARFTEDVVARLGALLVSTLSDVSVELARGSVSSTRKAAPSREVA